MNYQWQMPFNAGWALDYCREAFPELDENHLDETAGIRAALPRHQGHTVQVGPPYQVVSPGPPAVHNFFLHPTPVVFANESGPLDWDRSAVAGDNRDAHADANLGDHNRDGRVDLGDMTPAQRLAGYEDWSQLKYYFLELPDFADGAHANAFDLEMTYETYQTLATGPEITVVHNGRSLVNADTASLDFGRSQPGGASPERTLLVQNDGSQPLEISQLNISAGRRTVRSTGHRGGSADRQLSPGTLSSSTAIGNGGSCKR
jgi:hypothetical protein